MTDPVVGHQRARRLLEAHLPPVVLLRGPQSIGKWTLALHIAAHHRVAPVDRFVVGDGLTVNSVRHLYTWAYQPPAGLFKVALIDLTGASDSAHHFLLKVLEEPPPNVRFILTAAFAVPDTLVSRCATYTLQPLTVDELREVLLRLGIAPTLAARAATAGRGQVGPAVARASDTYLEPTLALVKAIATRDRELFEWAIGLTEIGTRDLLHRWIVEAWTGSRVLFSDEEMFGLAEQRPLLNMMLRRLSTAPAASARLQVRAALEPLLDR